MGLERVFIGAVTSGSLYFFGDITGPVNKQYNYKILWSENGRQSIKETTVCYILKYFGKHFFTIYFNCI